MLHWSRGARIADGGIRLGTASIEVGCGHAEPQHALPQSLPADAACAITGRMEPTREVGGDFIDFFLLEGGRIDLAVADV
jgi:serine phosphatase RsbU (regulator of sigma subunit)